MVISFEEKDRAAIEAKGMTVIEAKRVLYKAVEVFQPMFNKLWDICRNMNKEQIEECADRIIEAWGGISEKLERLAEELRKVFDKINKKIEEHNRLLRRPPKWYAKVNNPAMIVSRRRAYHCRDKC